MVVVTISGQIGTDAREVGRLAAQELQIDYVDREILVEAARTLGVPVESVVSLDERTASLGERLAAMLRRLLERSAAGGAVDPMMGGGSLDVLLGRTYAEAAADEAAQDISDERYLDAVTGIIRDLATHGDVVIIGRGSQVVLKDWPGALHVLLAAPLEQRIEESARREGIPEEEAAKRLDEIGKGRASFHRKFFKVDVDDPSLYHLSVNTARFPAEEAAKIIAEFARRVAVEL